MTDLPDNALIALARTGRAEAFEVLVRRHGHAGAALIRRMVADRHVAEDLFQETLLQAWHGIGQLRDDERFVAWFVQIARNQCRMHLRRRQPEVTLAEVPEGRPRTGRMGRGTGAASDPRLDTLSEALRELPGEAARAARMFYIAGLTIREIADATGSPQGTIKRRLHDARHQLRTIIESEDAP